MRRKRTRAPQQDFFEEPELPTPFTDDEEPIGPPKKKIMRGFEWFMFILSVVIIGIVALHEGGFPLVQKTESVEIVERPVEDQRRQQAQPVKYRDAEIDKNVDEVLKDIARSFSDEGAGNRVSKRELRKKGLDKQEAAYIKEVKEKNEEKGTLETAKDWYNVLKTSHATYSKVKNIFDGADGVKDTSVDKNAISEILGNEMLSNAVFYELEQKFNIPRERSAAFAKAGKKQLDDWATFVEENKNK